jgi:hypothetical protein
MEAILQQKMADPGSWHGGKPYKKPVCQKGAPLQQWLLRDHSLSTFDGMQR